MTIVLLGDSVTLNQTNVNRPRFILDTLWNYYAYGALK